MPTHHHGRKSAPAGINRRASLQSLSLGRSPREPAPQAGPQTLGTKGGTHRQPECLLSVVPLSPVTVERHRGCDYAIAVYVDRVSASLKPIRAALDPLIYWQRLPSAASCPPPGHRGQGGQSRAQGTVEPAGAGGEGPRERFLCSQLTERDPDSARAPGDPGHPLSRLRPGVMRPAGPGKPGALAL